jgi:DNA helicase-2/ATP-dependent DNA helicase PcrA
LEFLKSPQAELFLKGTDTYQYLRVRHVLVDEYQDTNPIQEEIYLTLVDTSKNLCVVRDDDQALYRFRGSAVECMVNFESACKDRWPGI